jgi:hypothetical protein
MKIKIILFALFLATQVQAQTKVWFDTDLMIGMPDKTHVKWRIEKPHKDTDNFLSR